MIKLVDNRHYQIRFGVFETNSSSTHCYVIRNREFQDDDELGSLDDPYIPVEMDSYDWGFDVLRSPREKLAYLLTYTKVVETHSDKITFSEFKELDGYKILNNVIQEKYHKDIYPVGANDPDSDINHQSQYTSSLRDLLDGMYYSANLPIDSTPEAMAEYIIFNPHVEIWITNDNCEFTPYNEDISSDIEGAAGIKLKTGSTKGFTSLGDALYVEKK